MRTSTVAASASFFSREEASDDAGEASALAEASRRSSVWMERLETLVVAVEGVGAAEVRVERTMAAPEMMVVVFILMVW